MRTIAGSILLLLQIGLLSGNQDHHREKRYLLFPFQGTFKTVFSFAIPWKLGPKQEMGVGWNFQFQFPLPYNTTAISSYPPSISRSTRDKRESEEELVSDRAVFYKGVERLLDRPNSDNGPDPALDISYSDAQKAGEFGADCNTVYPHCNMERSFFNLFSIYR